MSSDHSLGEKEVASGLPTKVSNLRSVVHVHGTAIEKSKSGHHKKYSKYSNDIGSQGSKLPRRDDCGRTNRYRNTGHGTCPDNGRNGTHALAKVEEAYDIGEATEKLETKEAESMQQNENSDIHFFEPFHNQSHNQSHSVQRSGRSRKASRKTKNAVGRHRKRPTNLVVRRRKNGRENVLTLENGTLQNLFLRLEQPYQKVQKRTSHAASGLGKLLIYEDLKTQLEHHELFPQLLGSSAVLRQLKSTTIQERHLLLQQLAKWQQSYIMGQQNQEAFKVRFQLKNHQRHRGLKPKKRPSQKQTGPLPQRQS
ncbi:hypothetical protein K469DRAFT_692211 [Zopfia rhizophila CBS 207.26]|uniref:Uncharacterized protein n=1 Tax=Zopfia rhizophila CBS 207.26 TaxID=1314779 RepID=A0A6A6DPF8_9PEZI|nr:hypothetical protein K469DRAFT_692211 [Zopfia rhizophila CBS 207.26]